MPETVLNLKRREEMGKKYAKKIRRTGKVPGIFYMHGEDSIPVVVDEKELYNVLASKAGVIDLDFGERKRSKCILREVQFDPVHGNPLHVDLMGIKLTEKIRVEVPVHLMGTPVGTTADGILQQLLRTVEVECLPLDIPEFLEVDVSHLNIGDAVRVGDIRAGKTEILADPDQAVAMVSPPTVVREEVVAPVEGVAEPEVIGREKKEEEAEQAGTEQKAA